MLNTYGRTFGVELEIAGAGNAWDVAEKLSRLGINCVGRDYGHTDSHVRWEVKTDSSLVGPNGESDTAEVASPVLIWGDVTAYEQVHQTMDALHEIGAGVNTTGGLHVHVGVTGPNALTAQDCVRVARLYGGMYYSIRANLAPSRHTNSYCSFPSYSETGRNRHLWQSLDEWADRGDMNDYVPFGRGAVNLGALTGHGTIEFRQHHATMSAREILRWAGFCVGLVALADETLPDPWPWGRAVGRAPEDAWNYLEHRGALDHDAIAFHKIYLPEGIRA